MRQIAQRDDIGDLILDGVDSLLGRYGYRKMTMEDLAQEVGIGKGTVYLHFPSKEEVVLSHIDRIVDRLLERLKEIRKEPLAPRERLRRMLVDRVMYRFDSVGHYTQSLNDLLSALRQSFLARRQRHFQKETALFAEALEEGRAAGALRFDDAKATAQALLWATNSLLPYSLSARELGRRKEIESAVMRTADLLLDGLVARSGRA
jgi:AcrR family transcriptional regulator